MARMEFIVVIISRSISSREKLFECEHLGLRRHEAIRYGVAESDEIEPWFNEPGSCPREQQRIAAHDFDDFLCGRAGCGPLSLLQHLCCDRSRGEAIEVEPLLGDACIVVPTEKDAALLVPPQFSGIL